MSKFKCLETVKIREEPSTGSDANGRIYAGNIVEFQNFVENDDRIWGKINDYEYCCIVDKYGQTYFSEIKDGDRNGNVSMLQKESIYNPVIESGCCFLCACYLGGLENIKEADKCWKWATDEEKVNASNSYVNMNKYDLAKEIAIKYGKQPRSGTIVKGNNHFYVVDQNNNEIFNSVRPGYGH